MGTNYVIHTDDYHEISVDEHSNRFTLMLESAKDTFEEIPLRNYMQAQTRDGEALISHFDSLHYLSPEQLTNMAIKMLQISLYWHKDSSKAHAEIVRRVSKLVA